MNRASFRFGEIRIFDSTGKLAQRNDCLFDPAMWTDADGDELTQTQVVFSLEENIFHRDTFRIRACKDAKS
jgi:hypothetical protein